MRSHINIAVPQDADPELTKTLLEAIRKGHKDYELVQSESTTGKYRWVGGYVHPADSARSTTVHQDAAGGLAASDNYISVAALAVEITSIISRVTGHRL